MNAFGNGGGNGVGGVLPFAPKPDLDNARLVAYQQADGFAPQAPQLRKLTNPIMFFKSGSIYGHKLT